MTNLKVKRPSLGTVLGFTALVVAIVGTASASPGRTIVRKGDIAKGAVTAKALASGAVHAKALAKGAVTAKALADGAVGANALGADAVTGHSIAPSAVYGGALGPVVVHSAVITDLDTTEDLSNWTDSESVIVFCALGERLLSGGVSMLDSGNHRVSIIRSQAINAPNGEGWQGQITSDSGGKAKAEVQAVCLK